MAFITPLFDLTGQGESFISKAAKDPFKLADPLGIAKNYIGNNNPAFPMLSPLFGDLSGLPSVLIHAAEYDVFYSDSVRFIEKASAAGVKAEIKVWRKMWHIFPMQDKVVPEAAKALKELCTYIAE
jgi:acetyl esterase/lipase